MCGTRARMARPRRRHTHTHTLFRSAVVVTGDLFEPVAREAVVAVVRALRAGHQAVPEVLDAAWETLAEDPRVRALVGGDPLAVRAMRQLLREDPRVLRVAALRDPVVHAATRDLQERIASCHGRGRLVFSTALEFLRGALHARIRGEPLRVVDTSDPREPLVLEESLAAAAVASDAIWQLRGAPSLRHAPTRLPGDRVPSERVRFASDVFEIQTPPPCAASTGAPAPSETPPWRRAPGAGPRGASATP